MPKTNSNRNMGFRASNALASIQAFQDTNRDSMKRASANLGIDDGESSSDVGQLRIENERLKTTLMILNQKMKMQEDTDDLSDKWKSQCQGKDQQISLMNEQIGQLEQDCEKSRLKLKRAQQDVA